MPLPSKGKAKLGLGLPSSREMGTRDRREEAKVPTPSSRSSLSGKVKFAAFRDPFRLVFASEMQHTSTDIA